MKWSEEIKQAYANAISRLDADENGPMTDGMVTRMNEDGTFERVPNKFDESMRGKSY